MITPPSLLLRLREPGDQAPWGEFVRLYTPLLYHWTGRLGLRGQDAEDLIQDVFLKLVRTLPSFSYDAGKSFRSWLRTLLLNRWRDLHRRRQLPRDWDIDPDAVADPNGVCPFEETEYRNFLVGQALQMMQAEFEPTTWKACWEYAVCGRPPADVAAELGVSLAVVYSAKSRVLRRLRSKLDGLLD